jgi:hypothetical protein
MKTDDVMLAKFEALEARISALEAAGAGAAVKPAAAVVHPVEPEGVRIVNIVERCPIAMPTEAERGRILSIVFGTYPKLKPDWSNARWAQEDEAEFHLEFWAAFERIARLKRTDEMDQKHALSWWTAEAEQFFRHGGRPIDIRGPAFVAAVIAAGDVKFTPGDQLGNSWCFALSTYTGMPAIEAWRRVLEGRLFPPIVGRFGAQTVSGVRIAAGE